MKNIIVIVKRLFIHKELDGRETKRLQHNCPDVLKLMVDYNRFQQGDTQIKKRLPKSKCLPIVCLGAW